MRRLPPAMRDELHARKRDLVLRTDPLGERSLGRLRRYALGGAVFIPILASLLWRFELGTMLLMVPLGAIYGLLVALLRPAAWQGGLLLWPFAILFLVLDGQSPFSSGVGFVWFYHLAHICIGAAVGAIEDGKGLE